MRFLYFFWMMFGVSNVLFPPPPLPPATPHLLDEVDDGEEEDDEYLEGDAEVEVE